MFVPFVDGGFGGADGFGDGEYRIGWSRRDDGQSGSQRSVIEHCVEQGSSQSLGSDAIAMSFRDPRDEAMQVEPTQVVGDPSRGELARLFPEQGSRVLTQMLVGEGALDEDKQQQDLTRELERAGRRSATPRRADCPR